MTIERKVLLEPVQLDGKEITFEHSFFVDMQEVNKLRAKLGLDGNSTAGISSRDRGQIATKLRNMGFLSNDDADHLGAIVSIRNNSGRQPSESGK